MNGFLVVDKPGGMTSHDVIARLRRVLDQRRVGHAGTLDPMATGVLLVGVGKGTRLLRFLEVHDKEYHAQIRFGITTTTQDAEGDVVEERPTAGLDLAAVRGAAERFVGEIEQVPPMVSAVKVGGERLYKKARRGETVERAPRPVTIHSLRIEDLSGEHATMAVTCSKGTYIRTLAADIGEVLGCGAHLSSLQRTRIGPFDLGDAVALDAVAPELLRPMGDALAGYPRRDVADEDAVALIHGKRISPSGSAGPVAIWGPSGLVAVCEDQGEGARSLCVLT